MICSLNSPKKEPLKLTQTQCREFIIEPIVYSVGSEKNVAVYYYLNYCCTCVWKIQHDGVGGGGGGGGGC